ncbi:MAG: ABC transporter ATP-binding protein [Candidatus Moeniiplasma glomeromycotorum]|nr:ABC transporter ATP-binding protein [Candidatus Moeniiplasma glomeromycotorum]MCE8162363.1 ABC transporter ATP-binding protein [Candidatus Moeniiplasma glomeromycotorum]MCE8166287.1 ABC transporter ATP-binding protein [Candidatus Moeniiplasma glomeromycotorum]MCE8166769.1 ABC transporter ATP-binding protein [Candidatus Moeniiplasma glomeromycotorum]
MKSPYLIKVANLTKNYQHRKVLGPLNLTIQKGEKIAIIGANGSGKTTLCEIMANLKKPTQGQVKYGFAQPKLTELLSINFQEQKYPDHLISRDLTDFYHTVYKKNMKQKKNEKLRKLLWKTFAISPLLDKKIASLSGGEKQRLNLYLSLFYQPQIFIGDEITTGLDIQTKIEVINFLKKQTEEQELTLILVSHHWDEIVSLCSRVILINKGSLIDDTTPQKIEKKYNSLLNYYQSKIT